MNAFVRAPPAHFFAPAPWTIHVNLPGSFRIEAADGSRVAVLTGGDEAAHHAQAIAALPELLSAAAAVLDQFSQLNVSQTASMMALRQAIWRAEGKL